MMKKMRNRICVRLENNENDYLKWALRPSFITHKIFGYNLVAIQKIKTTLTLNK